MSAASTLNRSEEDLLDVQARSDSFWDIGNYKKVVRRIDDGARLCSDLTKMAQERADIEAKYARHLQAWSKKWEDIVSKGPEYGSLETGWKATFKELQEPLKCILKCATKSRKNHRQHTRMEKRKLPQVIDGSKRVKKGRRALCKSSETVGETTGQK